VTSWDESIPLPLRFHVVHLYDAETGAGEYFHFGLELGEEPPGKDAAIAMPELTALTLPARGALPAVARASEGTCGGRTWTSPASLLTELSG
jgi:hypothetical protein